MHPDLRFANLSPLSSSTFYLRATSRSHDDEAADMTIMMRSIDGAWANYEIDAAVVAHNAFDSNGRHVFSLTPFGDLHIASPSGFFWEKLDPDPSSSPNRLRHMRDIQRIGESHFAVGMGRMAYERSPNGLWKRIDGNMRSLTGCGLLSVGGCDRENVYACGFRGEIWHFDGRQWQSIDSPTNVKLEQIKVFNPTEVVCSGARGIVIIGDGASWNVLRPTTSGSVLWGLTKYNDEIYVADNAQIYVVRGDELMPIELPFDRKVSTGRLQAKDGVLWSIGENDLLSFNGVQWTAIDYP